jgi:hypothetical protein
MGKKNKSGQDFSPHHQGKRDSGGEGFKKRIRPMEDEQEDEELTDLGSFITDEEEEDILSSDESIPCLN